MGKILEPKDQALYDVVDEVLHYLWDPIGISDVPAARNEYQMYVPQIFGLLRDGSGKGDVATYLSRIVAERIGMPSNTAHDEKVASILVEWRTAINKKFHAE